MTKNLLICSGIFIKAYITDSTLVWIFTIRNELESLKMGNEFGGHEIKNSSADNKQKRICLTNLIFYNSITINFFNLISNYETQAQPIFIFKR